MGIWIGGSMISVAELIQLLMNLIIVLIGKSRVQDIGVSHDQDGASERSRYIADTFIKHV